jgi:hypothetical protein
MRRTVAIFGLLCIVALMSEAQDSQKVLDAFKRNFAIASLDVKIQIIQDAAASKSASDMGSLYHAAVDFVIDNGSLIPTDSRFNQLASVAADQIAAASYQPAKYSLWKLFQTDPDTILRAHIAAALGVVGAGDAEIVQDLTKFLDAANSSFAAGAKPDLQVIGAVVGSLGKLADPSSFPILFTAMNLGYSDQISAGAKDALLAVKGDMKDLFIGIIKSGPIPEKQKALTMALGMDRLSADQKGQVAEYALDVALHTGAADAPGKGALRGMRFTAARALKDMKRSSATPLLIEHIDMTIMEFDRGLTDKSNLLEAIASLGAMGSHEAAVRLTQYLVLINSYTEKGRGYDEQVVLTVLDNLGNLGDKVGFDDLMYTQYLNYSAAVKKSARSALEKLKW